MDDADRAQLVELRDRAAALHAHQQRPRSISVDGICIDCEAMIDGKRLQAVPTAQRCAECENTFETRSKHYRAAR